jgi:hypothetical protein
MAGVTPKPRYPANVWIEKALPIFLPSTVADRIE